METHQTNNTKIIHTTRVDLNIIIDLLTCDKISDKPKLMDGDARFPNLYGP
jgi:hypothetical protein